MEETSNKSLFFGKKDLNGFLYYYYLPKQIPSQRHELSIKITKFKGSISLSPRKESIFIIEDIDDIFSKNFKENVPFEVGQLLMYNSSAKVHQTHIDKIKCIQLTDLMKAINSFESKEKEYDKLVKYGLPINANKDAMLAILNYNDSSKMTIYYEFPRVKKEYLKHNISDYDIPMFCKHITSGFSLFCTIGEKKFVEKYYSLEPIEKDESPINEEPISKTPQPLKEHSYCHLCKRLFPDYVTHVKSKMHKDNFVQNKPLYDQIDNCFKRIRKFWIKNETKKKRINNINFDKINQLEITVYREVSDEINESTQTSNLTQTNEFVCFKDIENESVFGKEIKGFRKRKYHNFLQDNPKPSHKIITLPPIIKARVIKYINK